MSFNSRLAKAATNNLKGHQREVLTPTWRRKLPRKIACFVPFVFALPLLSVSVARSQDNSADEDWQTFRQGYPYHVQGIALSKSEPGSSQQTLIIAEPPPHVTIAELQRIDADAFASPHIGKHEIGYDGWVRDIAISIPARTPAETQRLIDRLHIYLFGTAYKAYTLDISKKGVAANPTVNLRVTASDLDRWIFLADQKFHSGFTNAFFKAGDLTNNGKSGVYYSQTPGLVMLLLNKSVPLSNMTRDLRRFALDSDLVLGATSSATRVAVFARERAASVESLPPLRAETLILLANAKTSRLAQSYERMNVFAGRVKDAGFDWAPIYLSDDLIDTEYGSLLNITDQMLKSWSCNGQVRYKNFNYRDPQLWPFPNPISIDARLSEVTFNWNTKGAGYSLDVGGRKILALNRTGALPVSYIPGEIDTTGSNPLKNYEETAYSYFSGVQDPNLARVVQYAAFYQIFQENGIRDDSRPAPKYDHPEWEVLSKAAETLLSDTMTSDLDIIRPRANDSPHNAALRAKMAQEIRAIRSEFERGERTYGAPFAAKVAAEMANPRRTVNEFTEPALVRDWVKRFQSSSIGHFLAEKIGGSEKIGLYRQYAAAAAGRSSAWIHTPAVVISSTHDQLKSSEGGHNLDAKIGRFRLTDQVPQGDVKLTVENGSLVVLINPKDSAHVPDILRTAAISPTSADLTTNARKIMVRAPEVSPGRSMNEALLLGGDGDIGKKGSTRGLSPATPGAPQLKGWKPSEEISLPRTKPELALIGLGLGYSSRTIMIEKRADFTFTVRYPDAPREIHATSYDAAIDAVVSSMKDHDGTAGNWSIDFRGFSPQEGRNFVRTTEVQFSAQEDLKLTGFLQIKAGLKQTFGEPLSHYDFRAARMVESTTKEIVDLNGETLHSVNMKIEIPSVVREKPSLWMTIRLLFKNAIQPGLRLALERAVPRILLRAQVRAEGQIKAGMSKAEVSAHIVSGIKEDLRKIYPPGVEKGDFEIDFKHPDFGDFYIAEDCHWVGSHAG